MSQDQGTSKLKQRGRGGAKVADVRSLDARLRELSAEVKQLEAARAALVAGRATQTHEPRSVKARPGSVRGRSSSENPPGLAKAGSSAAEGRGSIDLAEDAINRRVVLAESSEMAAYLQKHLGQRLTAYLAGLKDVKTVGQWAKGRVEPPAITRERLRAAFHVTELFNIRYSDQAAQGWFFGANSSLDDRAPAAVLREAQTPDELATITPLARAFLRGAH